MPTGFCSIDALQQLSSALSIITDHRNATPLTLQQVDQLRLRTAIQASGLCVRLHELPIPEAIQKLVAAT